MRDTVNFEFTYRKKGKKGRYLNLLKSINVSGVTLLFIKSSGIHHELYAIFGIVPASLSVWVDYSLFVLLNKMKKKSIPQLKVE